MTAPRDPNPYAPPAARAAPRDGPPDRTPGSVLKWIYGAAVGLRIGCYAFLLASARASFPEAAQRAAATTYVILGFVQVLVALLWIRAAWSSVPAANRDGITPGGAVLRHFIPLYNVYWMFAGNMRLCDALDRTLGRRRGDLRAPKQLAVGAAVLQLIPAFATVAHAPRASELTQLACGGVWLVYMLACDRVRDAVAANVAAPQQRVS